MMESQGQALEAVLSIRKVNIEKLAKKLKVSRTTIYYWFKMKIVPYEHLEAISDALEWDIFNEMRDLLEKNDIPFYKHLKNREDLGPESQVISNRHLTQVLVTIDGTEETLNESIRKLQVISMALGK